MNVAGRHGWVVKESQQVGAASQSLAYCKPAKVCLEGKIFGKNIWRIFRLALGEKDRVVQNQCEPQIVGRNRRNEQIPSARLPTERAIGWRATRAKIEKPAAKAATARTILAKKFFDNLTT
ncbi:MAG: hypothetical protein IT427_00580 [Pirellulales bacterium]|nr:hypothetical protein [Pirellulales bacterium]